MKHDTGKRPAVVRESGKQRRLEIIEAALRVIARDGLRAVSRYRVSCAGFYILDTARYEHRPRSGLAPWRNPLTAA